MAMCHFAHQKSSINCPDTEIGCMSWEPATNCLCYGTFIQPPY